jgi:hypothetical protein
VDRKPAGGLLAPDLEAKVVCKEPKGADEKDFAQVLLLFFFDFLILLRYYI